MIFFSKKLSITVPPTTFHAVSVNDTAAFCTLNIHVMYVISGKSELSSGSFLLLFKHNVQWIFIYTDLEKQVFKH